jgi:hypothetical protein
MAATINSNLVIYDRLLQTSYLERFQNVLEIFNAASAGAIVMRNELIQGDFAKSAFYKLAGQAAHRNVNSTSTVTPSAIAADQRVSVKCPWKYGPYAATEESFKRRLRSIEEFSQVVGENLADASMQYMVQGSIAALTGAIGGNSALVATANWATDGKKVLTKGMRTFGDRASRVNLWLMNSATYFDLVDNSIDEKIFEEAGLVVYGGQPGTMGKRVLVTDYCPADTILGLVPGALDLVESQLPGYRLYDIDDQENLTKAIRAEGAFNLEVLGYAWDVSGSPAAPANPNLTQLGTAANWTKVATDDKATAGFIIEITT